MVRTCCQSCQRSSRDKVRHFLQTVAIGHRGLMKSHVLSDTPCEFVSHCVTPSVALLTDLVNLGWLLLGAEAAISHVDVGVTACAIATVELALAKVHLRLCQV